MGRETDHDIVDVVATSAVPKASSNSCGLVVFAVNSLASVF